MPAAVEVVKNVMSYRDAVTPKDIHLICCHAEMMLERVRYLMQFDQNPELEVLQEKFRDILKQLDLAKNKSCILISHRLKSTSFCDSIIVMENGKIIEKGTHESLMNEDTHYKSMYQIQSSYYQ